MNKGNDILNLYKKYKFDTINFVIEKDNIISKRNYTIEYQSIKVVEVEGPLF